MTYSFNFLFLFAAPAIAALIGIAIYGFGSAWSVIVDIFLNLVEFLSNVG